MEKRKIVQNYEKLLAKHGSKSAVARHLGIPRSTLRDIIDNKQKHLFSTISAKSVKQIAVPIGETKVLFFSAVQDKSDIHEQWLTNVEAYMKHRNGSIHLSSFTYNKRLFEENRKDNNYQTYHPRAIPYMDNRQFQIGKKLIWCGEMNTLPTAVSPLTGFETYTRDCWGIFPHAKVQLKSIPTMKGTPAKQIMTTGATTLPNYVQKRAGILASFHHVIGGIIVEIDRFGNHFCRQVQADHDGSFYDLNYFVDKGKVKRNDRVEAITWGDIHFEKLNETVANVNWGLYDGRTDSIIAELKPKYQFFHDATDFECRNHHSIKDPHFRYKAWLKGKESITEMFEKLGQFFLATQRKNCVSVVVESNHDLAVLRWLKEVDWRTDPINAKFNLRANTYLLDCIDEDNSDVSILQWAINQKLPDIDIEFLLQDESFLICDGRIECGMHGHLGPSGSRGSPSQFSRMGNKSNTGHTHADGIIDGVYTAGTSSDLDLGYNKGPSPWSNSHIVTYPNNKRTIITIQNGNWRG